MKMICDRCHGEFDGFTHPLMTAGYFDISGDETLDGSWAKYRKSPDEKAVCENCMFIDPKYIELYGRH